MYSCRSPMRSWKFFSRRFRENGRKWGQTTVLRFCDNMEIVILGGGGNASKKPADPFGRSTSCDSTGEQSTGLIFRGCRLPVLFGPAGGKCTEKRGPDPCLCPYDESPSPAPFRSPSGRPGEDDEARGPTLRPVCQSEVSTHGKPLGRPVSFLPRSGGTVPSGLSKIHRTEPGSSPHGHLPGSLPLVKLSGKCTGGRGAGREPSRVSGFGGISRGKAGGLSGVVFPGTGP